MSSIPMSKARDEMKDLVNRVAYGKERIFLTAHDKRMVAIVPLEDVQLLEQIEREEDARVAEQRMRKVELEGTIDLATLRKNLSLDVQT